MTTYFMIKNIFIYLLHISINVLFLGPPRGGSEKNGSGRPCSAPGKMRVDKVNGYAVGRKNCDMTGRAAPRRRGRWPLPLAPSALPPLRNSQCSQQVALTKISKTRQPIQIFQRKVFKKQTLQVGLGETAAA